MNNAEWVNKRGYSFKDITAIKSSSAGKPFVTIFIKENPIAKFKLNNLYTNDRLVLVWLGMEHEEEPLLDDVEKRYLSEVIKPFRNKITGIKKVRCSISKEFLYFYMNDEGDFYLPSFQAGTMYKGMKNREIYSLEELGL